MPQQSQHTIGRPRRRPKATKVPAVLSKGYKDDKKEKQNSIDRAVGKEPKELVHDFGTKLLLPRCYASPRVQPIYIIGALRV